MPFHMVWLATHACQLRCRHCSSSSELRRPDELTTAEARGLFDQLAVAGVVDLSISGGEPLLRKDIFELIEYAKYMGFAVGLGSHGAKLSKSQATHFREAGLDRFQVSLDGLVSAHETLRRFPGLFWRALAAIELALSAGLRVHVCCTINRLNVRELGALVELAAQHGVHRVNFSRYVPTGRGTEELDIPDTEWQNVARQCIELRKQYRGTLEITSHLAQQILVDEDVRTMPGHIGCQAGAGQGCVTTNGTVYPCVLLPIPLGSIRDRPFREIWASSPVNQALRNRANLKGKCGTCAVRDRCGGCRAVAYTRTGDYLAPDTRCWC